MRPTLNCGGRGGKPGPCADGDDMSNAITEYRRSRSQANDEEGDINRERNLKQSLETLPSKELIKAAKNLGHHDMPIFYRGAAAKSRLGHNIGAVKRLYGTPYAKKQTVENPPLRNRLYEVCANCQETHKPGPCKSSGKTKPSDIPAWKHAEHASQALVHLHNHYYDKGDHATAEKHLQAAKELSNQHRAKTPQEREERLKYLMKERGVTNQECVVNSKGVCVNCGGKGGAKGPCPEAAEAGERAKTGPGGVKFFGRYWGGREFSNIAKKMSEDATTASARAEKGFKTTMGGTNMSPAAHAEAAVKHRDAAEAHRIAQGDLQDAGKYVKARAHKDTARSHEEAASHHEEQAHTTLKEYLRTPGVIHKRKEGKTKTVDTRIMSNSQTEGEWEVVKNCMDTHKPGPCKSSTDAKASSDRLGGPGTFFGLRVRDAQKSSNEAHERTTKAEKSGRFSDHALAASAHLRAAKDHENDRKWGSKGSGRDNDKTVAAHKQAAKEHQEAIRGIAKKLSKPT